MVSRPALTRQICLLALAGLVVGEIWLARELFHTDRYLGDPSLVAGLIRATSQAAPLLLSIAAAGLLLGAAALRAEARDLALVSRTLRAAVPRLAVHAAAYGAFLLSTRAVLVELPRSSSAAMLSTVGAWVLTGLAVPISAAWSAIPLPRLLATLRRTRPLLLAATTVGGVAFGASRAILLTDLWRPLALGTTELARAMLELALGEQIEGAGDLDLGTSRFQVRVTRYCSGYEGIGLTLAFCITYLWNFRHSLRFPRSLVILPVATLIIWVCNSLRLAGLVAIGTWISPEVALLGFHSYAGWILFCGLSVGIVFLTRRVAWFAVEPRAAWSADTVNPAAIYLAPLLAILSTAFLTGAFSAGFDPLYPLRVLAALLALLLFRREYPRLSGGIRGAVPALLFGAAAFLVWVLLDLSLYAEQPDEPALRELSGLTALGAAAWIAFRVAGFIVTAPIAEELAFRGYLARRLVSTRFESVPLDALSPWAVLVSTVAFACLHERLIAGALAGLAYALALRPRASVWDAVLAHATTNLLLIVYAATTERWGVWL